MSDLTDAVIEQHLKTLKLPTMRRAYGQVARQAGADSWTYAEYLRELLDREIRAREASTTARRLREARFPDLKTLGQIDWDTMAGVSKQQIIELATCGFVLRLSILTRAPVQGRNDIVAAELQTISGVTTCQPNSGSWGFVGVDWATRQHQICVLDGDGKVVGERQVAHSGTGIGDLCRRLDELSGGHLASVHAAIEMPHGAVVEALLERGVQVYAINPKQLDRFRDRFTAAGAKDDRRDARELADSLRTDGRSFRHLQVESAEQIELREWSRMRDELQQERTRLTNRMREQLRRYYPQMLELGGDLGATWFVELWEKAPTPAEAARIRKASLQYILPFDTKIPLGEDRPTRLRVVDAADDHVRVGRQRSVPVRRPIRFSVAVPDPSHACSSEKNVSPFTLNSYFPMPVSSDSSTIRHTTSSKPAPIDSRQLVTTWG